ncbi:hypothetical protein ACFXA3_00145 [Streptomyces sp. NPDC059456]|uniref:hypothetical protein n=1 Tax=Streptomyces sp. NPDC059456 TaxID=3346838 RepID=UPI0036A1FC89
MPALELAWYGCDLHTGRITDELAAITAQGLSRRLGAATSASLDLALPGAPSEWETATDPGRTLLVAVDTLTSTPLWAGITLTRAGGSANVVQLGLGSPEGYLDRRYPGAYSNTADASTVIADLAAPIATDGLPITFDVTASGLTLDYVSVDTDDKSILSSIQTITAMEGAPEWTIDVVWGDAAHTQFALVMRIRPQIGTVSSPQAIFDMPGCISDYTLTESYESGKGATVVQASGDGEGEVRLQSDVQIASDLIAAGWPRWVHRYSPGTSVTDLDQLNAHAARTLALLQAGSRAWTVKAAASAAPRLGTDWVLGDSLGVEVSPGRSLRHPLGITLTGRAYGWDLDVASDQVSPILLED